MDEELVVVEVDRVHAVHGGGTQNQKQDPRQRAPNLKARFVT